MPPPIYLASPYTHKSGVVQEFRYRAARQNVARLLTSGAETCIYSPIVHCHWMTEVEGLPGSFDFWEVYDFSMIEVMPRFGILALPCWAASKGIAHERDYAKNLGREIEMFEPEGEFFAILDKIT